MSLYLRECGGISREIKEGPLKVVKDMELEPLENRFVLIINELGRLGQFDQFRLKASGRTFNAKDDDGFGSR